MYIRRDTHDFRTVDTLLCHVNTFPMVDFHVLMHQYKKSSSACPSGENVLNVLCRALKCCM